MLRTYDDRRTRHRRAWLALAVAAVPLPAVAADRYWVGTNPGDTYWDIASNWSLSPGGAAGAGQPANGDNAFISSATDLIVRRDGNSPAYAAPGVALIQLSNTGAALTQLSLLSDANSLVSTNTEVGGAGRGYVLHQGGSNTVTNELRLAAGAGSTGTYDLTGATARLNTGVWTFVGFGGTGVFNQSAGVHNPANLALGLFGGSTGTYNLTGGTLTTTTDAYVGYGSNGTFNQSGGAHTASTLTLGQQSAGVGTYNMSNGASLNVGIQTIGLDGKGTFNQTGGDQTNSVRLMLGATPTGIGTFNLSAGTFGTPSVFLGGNQVQSFGKGTLNVTGGTLNAPTSIRSYNANSTIVLDGGTVTAGALLLTDWNTFAFKRGTLNLTGGVSSNSGTFEIGLAPGTATVNLSAGTLASAIDQSVGRAAGSVAVFNQTGGTNRMLNLYAGEDGAGTYNLSGTGVLIADNVVDVGYGAGGGTFTHSGGTMTAFGLYVGDGAAGTYTLSGSGNLSATLVVAGYTKNGTYNQTGGAAAVTDATGFQVAAIAGASAANVSGGTLTTPNFYVGGSDTAPGGTGALTLTGGTVTASTLLKVWNAASAVTLTGGVLAAGGLGLPAGGPASMLTFDGGTWKHTGASATLSHAFKVNATGGTIDVATAATVLTLAGDASGPGTGILSKAGPGTLRITGQLAEAGGVTVNAGTVDFAGPQAVARLTVNAGGTTMISAGTTHVGDTVLTAPLAVNGTGRLDVGSRGLTVDFDIGQDTPGLTSIRGLIVQGYHATGPTFNNGDWKGAGITSALAQADTARAVGYARSTDVFNFADAAADTFLGDPAFPGQVLIRMTLAGDANLDGTVDFNDLVRLAQNYNTTVSANTPSWWAAGDFTYDGVTDFNDLVKLAQNYNTALPSEPVPGASADFQSDLAAAFASVPEPSAALACVVAGIGWPTRRRRGRASR
jgi:hypothetical protein